MTSKQQTGLGGRDAWVDYAKAIGIVLVVYGHVARGVFNAGIPMDESLYRLVDSVIYSFHMPLFFFLSGIFFFHSLQRRGPLTLAANKVDTILYPYILWSLIQGLIEVWLSRYTTGDVSLGEVLSLWDPRAQFWFLYALFLVILAALLVYRRHDRTFILGVLLLSALAYIFQVSIPSAWHSNYIVGNFVFFALGVWFNTIKERLAANAGYWALAGVLGFLVGQYIFHGPMGLDYSVKGLASLGLALVSILALSCLCLWLARAPAAWVLSLGGASMGIYLMHILAGSGTRIVLSRFLGVRDAGLHLLIGCLAGILLPMLVIRLARKVGVTGLFEVPPRLSLEAWYRRQGAKDLD